MTDPGDENDYGAKSAPVGCECNRDQRAGCAPVGSDCVCHRPLSPEERQAFLARLKAQFLASLEAKS